MFLFRLARDHHYPSIDRLLQELDDDQEKLRDWLAFYLMEASDQNPEITKWDDERVMKRKLDKLAAANNR